MQDYVKALNAFYRSHPAFYEKDFNPEGFEWINNISANENMVVFTRNAGKKEDMLLVVANFSPLTYEKHKIGVPYPGKYKEIFNSDKKEFGGSGAGNPRLKQSKKDECDDRPDSITITVPPMSVTIFSYTKSAAGTVTNKKAKSTAKAETKSLKDALAEKMESELAAGREAKPAKRRTRKTAGSAKATEKADKPTKALESAGSGRKASGQKKISRTEYGSLPVKQAGNGFKQEKESAIKLYGGLNGRNCAEHSRCNRGKCRRD